MVRSVLKVLLVIVFLALIATGIFWLMHWLGYPLWVGAAILAGFAGIWLGVIFLKRFLFRRKEKEFVQRVIEHDEKAIKRAPVEEQLHLRDLQEKWKESVDLLRHSYLRKKGNPLYVLPWYLIIGESGAGKTTAIKNTNLNSPISDITRAAGITVTRNCEWWFFEEAVILDTAGRYTIPVDPGIDKEEWEEFLTLLSKYRKREPVNGIIVTIAADKLQKFNEAQLSDDGLSARKRIDQLMRVLGAKIPVYVLVTKMDLVQGMVEFTNLLSSSAIEQAMGYSNRSLTPDWKSVLDDALYAVADNLKNLQYMLLRSGGTPEPEVFLFVNNFERLKLGLEVYVQAVFKGNPYQETPLFRGIYFTSAVQEGRAVQTDTSVYGLSTHDIEEISYNNGIFLKDLFKRILPEDRGLFSPIRELLALRRSYLNIGYVSWFLVWVSLTGLMSFSYLTNRNALGVLTRDSYRPQSLSSDNSLDLSSLMGLSSSIDELKRANRHWIIPYVGFNHSREVEHTLTNRFRQMFGEEILKPFDARILETVSGFDTNTDDALFLEYYRYYMARIALLEGIGNGSDAASWDTFGEYTERIMKREYTGLSEQSPADFCSLYRDYLTRDAGKALQSAQLRAMREQLAALLKTRPDLTWITRTVATDVPAITLTDFWTETDEIESTVAIAVPGIFTNEGRLRLEQFFRELDAAVTDSTAVVRKKKDFWDWYRREYTVTWEMFARSFHEDIAVPDDPEIRQRYASIMSTAKNPYFLFLERMANEFADMPGIDGAGTWISLVSDLNNLKKLSAVENTQDSSLLGKITDKANPVVALFEKLFPGKGDNFDQYMRAARAWREYNEALGKLAPASSSPEASYQMVAQYYTFSRQTAQSISPFTDTDIKFSRLKSYLTESSDDSFIWNLVEGPERFILDFSVGRTAIALQDQWEEEVLGGLRGTEEKDYLKTLFDKSEGLVWTFVNGTGKPFIARGTNGYYARNDFPFRRDFIRFLNSSTVNVPEFQTVYIVTLETLPLEVNIGAGSKPYACILELRCANEEIVLENYNYQREKTFNWNPESCSDTSVTILFKDMEVTKRYEGQFGFADFLYDFRDGSRRFTSEEFIVGHDELKKQGITWIKVSYRITGSKPIIDLYDRMKAPVHVPETIVMNDVDMN